MSDEVTPDKNQTLNIYPDFSSWIMPAIPSLNRDDFKLRWETLHRLFIDEYKDEIDSTWVDDLIISSLDLMTSRPNALNKLRDEIRKDDFVFPGMEGSHDEELKVISSYCLRLLIDNEIYDTESACQYATKILSASLNGIKSYKGGINLSDLAKSNLFQYIRILRERTTLKAPTINFKTQSKTNDALSLVDIEQPASATYNQQAILALFDELQIQLSTVNDRIEDYVKRVNIENKKASEEQEVLWFVNLGWSEKHDTSYSELSINQRILDFAQELEKRTHIEVELPSVKALANKAGIESKSIVFNEWVESLISDDLCDSINCLNHTSELTPCLYALQLASKGNWISEWEKQIGLESNFEINSLELALQLYREHLVLRW